ncbi:hypothetical protein [Pseudomonas sp. R5-89-07]|uniref:hypothetical protein n=1 Tax=Pseudomonas sp. R5-89-07 TaxID=658644 RepID=UPI0013DD92EB|nr:hypothetical protein [Pseudomonas sp. R5-89-07]
MAASSLSGSTVQVILAVVKSESFSLGFFRRGFCSVHIERHDEVRTKTLSLALS